MQIVFIGDILYEMSNPVSGENKKNMYHQFIGKG